MDIRPTAEEQARGRTDPFEQLREQIAILREQVDVSRKYGEMLTEYVKKDGDRVERNEKNRNDNLSADRRRWLVVCALNSVRRATHNLLDGIVSREEAVRIAKSAVRIADAIEDELAK